jgi:NAD(P)H dehydrogenase (quinone)
MRQIVCLMCLFALLPVLAPAQDAEPRKAGVLVVYFSDKGHTKAMAEAVARGAGAVDGATATVMDVATATPEDVLNADAVIVGSPVYKANVAPKVQEFINSWPIKDPRLRDKIGAAFATGSGLSAGEEIVQTNILQSMLVCQMITVGGPGGSQPFGASAMDEDPSPGAKDGAKKEEELVAAHYLKKGEALGKRVAELAVRLKNAK